MTVQYFTVSTKELGYKQTVRVHIYDDLDQLRRTARKFALGAETFHEAAGCVQSVVRFSNVGQKNEKRVEIYHMRLHTEHLGTSVIVHEVNHAVMAMLTNAVGDDMSLGEVLEDFHEPVAYAHSDLTRGIVDKLYDLGHYNRPKED